MGGSFVRSSHRGRHALLLAVALSVSAAVPAARAEGPLKPVLDPVVGDPGDTFPDLVPDVTVVGAYQTITFDPDTGQAVEGPPEMFFDTWSKNLGEVALDLQSDEPTNVTNPAVSQCTSWYDGEDLVCRERRTVGGFELHPTHGHFHFNDFGRYELRRLLQSGSPDYSSRGLIDISDKVSFCLIDSTPVRSDARPVPTYVLCGSTREGISAGWADIYTSDLEGQQLSLAGLSDGRYALVVTMDGANHVFESDDTNNRVVVTVQLSNLASANPQAVIVDKTWPPLDDGTCTRKGKGGQSGGGKGKGRC